MKKVQAEYYEDDQYIIELADGWQLDGCHSIFEDTKKQAKIKLKQAQPCECVDCKRGLELKKAFDAGKVHVASFSCDCQRDDKFLTFRDYKKNNVNPRLKYAEKLAKKDK